MFARASRLYCGLVERVPASRIRRYLAANVRKARLARKLAQQELAERADISVRHLQDIEAGSVDPRASVAYSIAAALGVDMNLLFREAVMERRPAGRPRLEGEPAKRKRRR